jgi:hypothetical protein
MFKKVIIIILAILVFVAIASSVLQVFKMI